MNFRNPRSLLRSIPFILIVIGLLFLAFSGYLTPVTRLVLDPVVNFQTRVSEQYAGLRDFFSSPRDTTILMQRNQELEIEVSQLQAQIIELQQQLTEYQILSALLDFARANPAYSYTGASVIGRDPSPFLHYVLINRGSDDGIRRGMPVVTQQGLVGRVSHVTSSAARVQLITDPAVTVNIRLQPGEAEALLSGSITGDLSLDFIPQDAGVNPGDLVLTSGLGGNFPSNILIGQVSSVRSQAFDLFQNASVQPVVDFTKLDIVLIITNFNPIDLSPLIPDQTNP